MSLSVCDHQSLEAVLAVDVEALEQFGVFEGIEADGTGQLVLQLLQGLLGNRLRGHPPLDKNERVSVTHPLFQQVTRATTKKYLVSGNPTMALQSESVGRFVNRPAPAALVATPTIRDNHTPIFWNFEESITNQNLSPTHHGRADAYRSHGVVSVSS